MSFIERGLNTIIHLSDERNVQLEELKQLNLEDLRGIHRKSDAISTTGAVGKYAAIIAGFMIATKGDMPEVGLPLMLAGSVTGLSAELHHGVRSRVAKELIRKKDKGG